MPWKYGDQIALRYRGDWGGTTLNYVMPVTVIHDSLDYVALYLAAGTPIKAPAQADGRPVPRTLPFEERAERHSGICDAIWHTNSRLFLGQPGSAHLYSAWWRASDWSFLGWYVDLQAPFARTAIGFDSQDYVLDLLIDSDLNWTWKDEDEFADAVRVGRFTPDEAAAIRSEGEAIIRNIETGGWPFNNGWDTWRPDPAWPIPSIPDGWDRPVS